MIYLQNVWPLFIPLYYFYWKTSIITTNYINKFMKIASITIFCNEFFRIKNWLDYYQEYKNDIDLHVIVNNGNKEDTEVLKSIFPLSLVLFSQNRSLTASYNFALNEILKDKDVDVIMQITNDIKVEKNSIRKLYDFLRSNAAYGMVSPVLLKKDEEIIELYGAQIHPKNLSFVHLEKGKHIEQIADIQVCDGLPGGMNMASREFYEKVGLQDEFLFMYADEVDMGIRGKSAGFQFAVTKNIKAWHQHINPPGLKTRNPMAAFLMGRNVIYLAKKHFNSRIVLSTILQKIKHAGICNLSAWLKNKSKDEKKFWWWYFKGIQAGIFNQISNPFIKDEN